jgi:hypothetical protein
MGLWWLEPGWTDACCCYCGARIHPEGDPDWGRCFQCFSEEMGQREAEAAYYAGLEEQQPSTPPSPEGASNG